MAVLSASRHFGRCKVDKPDDALFRCAKCCGRNRPFQLHSDWSASFLWSFLQELRVCA